MSRVHYLRPRSEKFKNLVAEILQLTTVQEFIPLNPENKEHVAIIEAHKSAGQPVPEAVPTQKTAAYVAWLKESQDENGETVREPAGPEFEAIDLIKTKDFVYDGSEDFNESGDYDDNES